MLGAASLCKGTYHIQQGDLKEGLQLSTRNMEYATNCRKCPFTLPASNVHGQPRFDDRAHSTSKSRWRSLPLLKAHLDSGQKKKRVYKCLMCVFQGHSTPTYEGEHDLFEHMIDHQGGVLNGVELWGPLCLETSGPRMGLRQHSTSALQKTPGLRFQRAPSKCPSASDLRSSRPIAERSIDRAPTRKQDWK